MINKYDKNGKLKKRKGHIWWQKIKEGFHHFLFSSTSEKEKVLTRGRKPRKPKRSEEDIKIPTEVEILILKYHLDLAKINYKDLLKTVGFVCSFDIAFIIAIVSSLKVDNVYISLLIGGVLVIPIILISYSIVGNYYKKKGLVVRDEKRNVTNK